MTCRLVATLALVLPLGACGGLYGNDEIARYVQRADTITLSAGNSKHVNATTHTIDPWPPGVHDRRIPANGERMVRGIERYRRGPAQAQPAATTAAGPGGGAGATATPAAADVALPAATQGVEPGQAPPALE